MRKYLLLFLVALFAINYVAFAQESGRLVKGRLLDAQTKDPLIGATITVKGTTKAVAVALDGTFKINVPEGSKTLLCSYIGYVPKEVQITSNDLGTITLDPTSASMKEVNITANQSLAINRQTPIAASSVGKVYIEEKGAGAEFPELLKATPGVMTSKLGGGYGDSRINIRGFSSNNVALLINGLPVNDVEAGKIYWNDWAGLADVTTSMQVQRGLGASTAAVPSLGGTINITTMSTESQQGGTISQSIGSYNSLKTLISYSTGLNDKGWAASFLLSRSTGDGYAEGLYYTGYSYFTNISKVLSPSQTLSFSIMGASQNHGQRYTYNYINTYRAAPQGIRYNSDYGYLNGQLLSAEQNFYNKPLASLNHNWKINETSSLSTVLYASYGKGAAVYLAGATASLSPINGNVPRAGNAYSTIDFDQITKNNLANTDASSTTYLQNSQNEHKQYGLLSTYKKKLTENINFLAGIDARYYEGEHFNKINNLLGGTYFVDNRNNSATSPSGNINNPGGHIVTDGKFNNDYRYEIGSEGIYLQTEYVKNNLSAFVALAANNTSNRRVDYFNYVTGDANATSKWVNFLGYQAKGGANYNIDNQNNIFANIGYIQRAPLVAAIFLNKKNDLNSNAIPEKLLSYELGYGFRSSIFSANVNLFRSTYKDRSKVTSSNTADQDGTFPTINISGLNEVHQGIEIDAKLRPVKDVTFSGMLSVGDYHYLTNTGPVQITSQNGPTVNQPALFLKGKKVGEFGTASTGAQTTAALGLDVNVLPQVKLGANYNYYARYYASYDPTKMVYTYDSSNKVDFDPTAFSPYRLPNFSTLDLNVVFRFKLGGMDASFIGNVYNVLDTEYLADGFETSPSNSDFVTRTNKLGVWYGSGRTYMTTLKIKF